MTTLTIGEYDKAFKSVVDRFEAHLATSPRSGGALALYVDGAPVIDVWGGLADAITGRPWERDTMTVAFSCTKSVSAIVVLHLVEQGVLGLDEPVCSYWPEFGANGKESVTIRHVMAHRAGIPLVDAPLTFDDAIDGAPVVEAIEAQGPLWHPGSAHAYHALTYGAILDELVKRVTGQSLGALLRERFSAPLELEVWIGLPTAEHVRVAPILPCPAEQLTDEQRRVMAQLMSDDDRAWRAVTYNGAVKIPIAGFTEENSWNYTELWSTEIPAGNAIGTARGFATLHAALVSSINRADTGAPGPTLLTEPTISDATKVQSEGQPFFGPVLPAYPRWGTGFMLPSLVHPMLGPTSFGHDGAAGALCFADHEARVGFAFLPNQMGPLPDLRADGLVDELRTCLD